MTNKPEPNTRPLPQPSELVERLRATIIQDVCELPDYNSPDDQPDLLQCTVEELQIILTRNLEAFGQCDLTDFAPLTNSALRAQIAKLQARLEVVPGWSEDADGIACRNDTIKLQDECIAKLQADGDKLAGAATALRDDMLMRAEMHKRRNNGELVVEAGNGVWRRINAALTEWKNQP